MSQENVELVVGLYQPSDADNVPLYRDDSLWTEFAGALAPFFHADFECVWYQFGGEKRYAGLDGLRDFMRDWTRILRVPSSIVRAEKIRYVPVVDPPSRKITVQAWLTASTRPA